MTRTLQDQDLLIWEAYATTGDYGYPQGSRMMFHCITDPGRRARFLEREWDKSDVEGELSRISDDELLRLFEETGEMS